MNRFSRIPLIPPTRRQRSRRSMTPSYNSATSFYSGQDCSGTIGKNMPQLTAQAWSITDETGNILWGKAADEQKDIASLSKMMTLYVTYRYVSAGVISFDKEIYVSDTAAGTHGTTAYLKRNDCLKLSDLCYAMMLPSGNDAANVLAEEIGKLVFDLAPRSKRQGKTSYQAFIDEMNNTAHFLGLRSTKFANPHGLAIRGNRSTAHDLGKLGSQILAIDELAAIVSTKQYSCTIQGIDGPYKATWYNTNRLLWSGFCGIKTGTTNTAGFCLTSSVTRNGTTIIITILNARTCEKRWAESTTLADWAFAQLQESQSPFVMNLKTGKLRAWTN